MFRKILTVKSIGDLNQNSRTISHQLVGTDGTPVIEIFKNFEPLLNNGVTFMSLDMRYKANSAGVMLMRWVVEPLGFWEAYGRSRGDFSGR